MVVSNTSAISYEILSSAEDLVRSQSTIPFTRFGYTCTTYCNAKDTFVERLLCMTNTKLYTFTLKVPSKIDVEIPFIDIEAITFDHDNNLTIQAEKKKYVFRNSSNTCHTIEIILRIANCIKFIYPGISVEDTILNVNIEPNEVMRLFTNKLSYSPTKDEVSPCDGLAYVYAACCDKFKVPYREDFVWDLNMIYYPFECHEIRLNDFLYFTPKDLIPIIFALRHHKWFTSVRCEGKKLPFEMIEELMNTISISEYITTISCIDCSFKSDFIQRISKSISSNPKCVLKRIEFSQSNFGDKGAIALASAISNLRLSSLTLKTCNLTSKSLNVVSNSLLLSSLDSLTSLNISDNELRNSECQNFFTLLTLLRNLNTLNLSNTNIDIDKALLCLKHSSTDSLTELILRGQLMKSKYDDSKNGFFQCAKVLNVLDLDSSKLGWTYVKNILCSLSKNPNPLALSLKLSSLDLKELVRNNCQLLALPSIQTLDVFDCSLEVELEKLCDALTPTQIKALSVGKNVTSKTKGVEKVVKSLLKLITENTSLESLSICDSKLREYSFDVIKGFCCNSSLREFDISGNLFGDSGAKLLAKVLQVNKRLECLSIDKCGITSSGFEDLALAMEKNFSIKVLYTPFYDALLAIAKSPEKTIDALKKIESSIARNNKNITCSSDFMYRLQTSLLYNPFYLPVSAETSKTATSSPAELQSNCRSDPSMLMNSDLESAFSLLNRMHGSISSIRSNLCSDVRLLESALKNIVKKEFDMVMQDLRKTVDEIFPTLSSKDYNIDTEFRPKCNFENAVEKTISDALQSIRSKLDEHYLEIGVTLIDKIGETLVNSSNDLKFINSKFGEDGAKASSLHGTMRESRTISSMPRSRRSDHNEVRESIYENFVHGLEILPDLDGKRISSELLDIVAAEEKILNRQEIKPGDDSSLRHSDNVGGVSGPRQLNHFCLNRPVRKHVRKPTRARAAAEEKNDDIIPNTTESSITEQVNSRVSPLFSTGEINSSDDSKLIKKTRMFGKIRNMFNVVPPKEKPDDSEKPTKARIMTAVEKTLDEKGRVSFVQTTVEKSLDDKGRVSFLQSSKRKTDDHESRARSAHPPLTFRKSRVENENEKLLVQRRTLSKSNDSVTSAGAEDSDRMSKSTYMQPATPPNAKALMIQLTENKMFQNQSQALSADNSTVNRTSITAKKHHSGESEIDVISNLTVKERAKLYDSSGLH